MRIVASEHASLVSEYAQNWYKFILLTFSVYFGYRLVDCVTCVSEGLTSELRGLSRLTSRVVTVRNPWFHVADQDTTGSRDARLYWNEPDGFKIITVGVLKAQKNHELLIECISELKNRKISLLIVGDGPRKKYLEKLVSDKGLCGHITFFGYSPTPLKIMMAADLFVLSSNYEGFPNVLMEALSIGLPVVSTDCNYGPSEILMNGRFGLLVPPGDLNQLKSAIERALAGEKLPTASTEDLVSEFGTLSDYIYIYKRILSHSSGATC